MRIIAEKCYAGELMPGELFSSADQMAWDTFLLDEKAVGQRVYIRTEAPCPENQARDVIYRITIHSE